MINFADCLKMTQYVYGFANVSLGDIAKVERGKRITKSETKDRGKYPVFCGSLNPLGYLDEWNFPGDRVLVINKGNAGDIGYRRERFFAGEPCFVLTASEYVIPKYLYHYLCSRRVDLKQRVRGVIPILKTVDLENFPVILPPLEKQIEIVNRLNVVESYLAVGCGAIA